MSSCDGKCCKALFLIGSPDELYDAIMRRDDGSETQRDHVRFWLQLRCLGKMRGVEWSGNDLSSPSWRYFCTRLDWKTGKCTIYEDRPYICREHAEETGRPCNYLGCKHENALKFLEYKPGTATHETETIMHAVSAINFTSVFRYERGNNRAGPYRMTEQDGEWFVQDDRDELSGFSKATREIIGLIRAGRPE